MNNSARVEEIEIIELQMKPLIMHLSTDKKYKKYEHELNQIKQMMDQIITQDIQNINNRHKTN